MDYITFKSFKNEGENVMKDVILNEIKNEVMKELIISKEDFRKYFNGRNIISKKEYEKYLKIKIKLNIKNNIYNMKKINTILTL